MLEEADRLGYRRINIIPRESYDNVFGSLAKLPSGGTAESPLSVKNNNPGNLRPVKGEGFRKFETPQEGILALKEDLASKIGGTSAAMKNVLGEGYEPSISNLISVYAPQSENDTAGYANFIAQKLGVDPDYVLKPEDIDRLIPAIVEFEGGAKAVDYFKAKEKPKKIYRVGLDGKVIR